MDGYLDAGTGSTFFQIIICGQYILPFALAFVFIGKVQQWTGIRQKWLAFIVAWFGAGIAQYVIYALVIVAIMGVAMLVS